MICEKMSDSSNDNGLKKNFVELNIGSDLACSNLGGTGTSNCTQRRHSIPRLYAAVASWHADFLRILKTVGNMITYILIESIGKNGPLKLGSYPRKHPSTLY